MPTTLLPLPGLPAAGQQSTWTALPDFAAPAALYNVLRSERRFALVITRDAGDTQEWLEALRFLSAGDPDFTLTVFPDQEILPYDHFSPHPDITSERLLTLYRLQSLDYGVCLASASTLLARLCPREYVNRESLSLAINQQIDPERIKQQLESAGYQHRDNVFEHGEYAVRGSLLDVFPMGSDTPYRIELFDDEIDSLRTFDPETQRSCDKIDGITILPAGEVALDIQAINCFRDAWHQEFSHNPDVCPIYQDSLAGIPSAGIESYLPMFFESTESLLDYLPDNSLALTFEDLEKVFSTFLADTTERHQQQSIDPTRPLLSPARLYLKVDECFARLKPLARINIASNKSNQQQDDSTSEKRSAARGYRDCDAAANPALLIDEHAQQPLSRIQQFLAVDTASSPEETVNVSARHALFCVESAGRRELFIDKLKDAGIAAQSIETWQQFEQRIDASPNDTQVGVAIAAFNRGASFTDACVSVIAEPELFGITLKPKARRGKEKTTLAEATIHNLIELRVGAPIVHIDHGVGRYLGLQHMPVDGGMHNGKSTLIDAEFLTLEYAGGDRLYVPVTSLHLISRYMGGDETVAPLNKLGSENWGNAKQKAIANVHDVAAELLDVYARRKSMPGHPFKLEDDDYRQFSEQFPFEETPDQRVTIEAVIDDMRDKHAMDRLVCGDVGFGKTEVAMRAAFVAVSNSKQVMVLVPTTLLAQQHHQNFQDRFADWPVSIDTLSRFRTSSEQSKVLASFASGNTDILIGTHKLIQKDVDARDLGLVIVDEEHRFGVRQKEQLKRICASVDLLTMTATPIPRTLNMAIAGLRDLSIITTPPARRLSVKTFVHEKQNGLLKEALLRELLRGGQVFYLHNDVSSIERTADEIRALVPDARVSIGHGQMPERQLEQVMSDFYHKRFNVLVCTTIIETGIDIPNANTIIIERADKFGLAQLHQLRGRVGRSHHQAYAYLFIPNRKQLTKDAEKRLDAIAEAQDLGAGFLLATHDLEIRGAGELLGDDQSGHVQSIGFTLYLDMLERAVSALKAGKDVDLSKPLNVLGDINLHLPALIPDDYLPDVHNRLILYKRIANATNAEGLRELQVEMIDRFGLLSEPVKNLFAIMDIKLACIDVGIKKIDAGEHGGYIDFSSHTDVDPLTIVTMVQQEPETFRLAGATRLTFHHDLPESGQRLEWIDELIARLGAQPA